MKTCLRRFGLVEGGILLLIVGLIWVAGCQGKEPVGEGGVKPDEAKPMVREEPEVSEEREEKEEKEILQVTESIYRALADGNLKPLMERLHSDGFEMAVGFQDSWRFYLENEPAHLTPLVRWAKNNPPPSGSSPRIVVPLDQERPDSLVVAGWELGDRYFYLAFSSDLRVVKIVAVDEPVIWR